MIDFSAHPLVETAWLAAHLSDGDLRIVDARWRGDGTSRELYQRGHLPGAVHLDWHADLSWTDERGVRDLLLPPEPFATVMEREQQHISAGLLILNHPRIKHHLTCTHNAGPSRSHGGYVSRTPPCRTHL